MFTKRIIPCLDVNKGRVVKGVNFVDLKDAGDPVEIAKAYDAAGADELVFLDITASCEERDTVVDMVQKEDQMADGTFISTVDVWILVLMRLNGQRKPKRLVQAKSFLPVWIVTEQKRVTILN